MRINYHFFTRSLQILVKFFLCRWQFFHDISLFLPWCVKDTRASCTQSLRRICRVIGIFNNFIEVTAICLKNVSSVTYFLVQSASSWWKNHSDRRILIAWKLYNGLCNIVVINSFVPWQTYCLFTRCLLDIYVYFTTF